MTAQQEIQNKRVAGFSTAGIFAVLFVLMFYIIIWSPGNPPAFEGGSGIELNFGTADAGFGDVQPTEQVGDNAAQDEAPAQSEAQSTPSQEQPEANTPQQTPVKTDEAIQDIKSEEESPVKVTPAKEAVKEPAKVKEAPKKEEPKKVEPKKEEPKVNPATTFNGGKTATANQKATGDGKTGAAGNHGDQKGATGDQGNPQGKLDADALYGNPGKGGPGPGGEGGVGLEMSGWNWDSKPEAPALKDNDSGFVIFEITIDDQGDIIGTRVIERTLSSEAVKLCEDKLRAVSFRRTANTAAPAQSKGRVRFNLVVR